MADASFEGALIDGVELLSLDAGNTVIFLDHDRLAGLIAASGLTTTAAALIAAEAEAKRLLGDGKLLSFRFRGDEAPGARGWAATVGTFLVGVGAAEHAVPELLEALWPEHVKHNLWSLVPPDLSQSLLRLRAAGVPVMIVSNSEGMLDALFAKLGIDRLFDCVIDSGCVGVEKPDPRIFEIALERFGVDPQRALHLGDTIGTDVLGAQRASMRAALIDPYGAFDGMFLEVPRVPSVAAVADAIVRTRAAR